MSSIVWACVDIDFYSSISFFHRTVCSLLNSLCNRGQANRLHAILANRLSNKFTWIYFHMKCELKLLSNCLFDLSDNSFFLNYKIFACLLCFIKLKADQSFLFTTLNSQFRQSIAGSLKSLFQVGNMDCFLKAAQIVLWIFYFFNSHDKSVVILCFGIPNIIVIFNVSLVVMIAGVGRRWARFAMISNRRPTGDDYCTCYECLALCNGILITQRVFSSSITFRLFSKSMLTHCLNFAPIIAGMCDQFPKTCTASSWWSFVWVLCVGGCITAERMCILFQ